jgi:hypothetical protein
MDLSQRKRIKPTMKVEHPAFPRPDPSAKLWRYMNWDPKFTDLVQEERLWMSWLSMFDDKFEGKTPTVINENLQRALSAARNDAERAVINENMEKLRRFSEMFYPHYYVSCWAMSDTEDNLLWNGYTSKPESVTVQTTFERLERALPQRLVGNDLNIGMVTYIDYRTGGFKRLNMFEWPMHKRRPYASEREVRALAYAGPNSSKEIQDHLFEGGEGSRRFQVCIPPVDPSILVEAIYLHPRADDAFAARAVEYCRANGLPDPRRSELAEGGTF